jgi:hypothetical protein
LSLQETSATIALSKLNLDDRALVNIGGRVPQVTGFTGWTSGFLLDPVDLKSGEAKALTFSGLPTGIVTGGTDQIHAIRLLTGHEQASLDIATINQVILRQQVLSLEGLMDGVGDIAINDWG